MNGYIATVSYQDGTQDVPLVAANMQEALVESFAFIADKTDIVGFSVTRLEQNPDPQTENP